MKFVSSTAMIFICFFAGGCSSTNPGQRADLGRMNTPDLMTQYGCPTCHVIPGVPGAVGKVGPSLESLAQRSYLAGTLQNSPDNVVRWLQHPQQIHPGTAMPEMGVTPEDAARMTVFLEAR